jgi:hypothetical protein
VPVLVPVNVRGHWHEHVLENENGHGHMLDNGDGHGDGS